MMMRVARRVFSLGGAHLAGTTPGIADRSVLYVDDNDERAERMVVMLDVAGFKASRGPAYEDLADTQYLRRLRDQGAVIIMAVPVGCDSAGCGVCDDEYHSQGIIEAVREKLRKHSIARLEARFDNKADKEVVPLGTATIVGQMNSTDTCRLDMFTHLEPETAT